MRQDHYLVPLQLSGFENNVEHTLHTNAIEDAEDWFVDAKERLLDVNNWTKYCLAPEIKFNLTDIHGRLLNRKAHNADHIRIDNNSVNAVCNWAAIEALEYDDYPDLSMETFAMRIRPCLDPQHISGNHEVNAATSTIVIERIGKRLSASFHGRNESQSKTPSPVILCLSDSQLAQMMKGFIN